MLRVLKSLAFVAHCLAARNRHVAEWYLGLFRILKVLPDGHWKAFVLNSLHSIDWPDPNLLPSKVWLTSNIRVTMVPHLGEFDFAGHIYRRIDYEPATVSWLVGRQY